MALKSINPATGEVMKTFETESRQDIERKLARSQKAFDVQRKTPLDDRLRCLQKLADVLEARKDELGRLMTLEMGKPIKAAVQEAQKCAWACRYYVENAARFVADEVVETSAARSFVRYLPIGPVLAVMPWNFPFWQVFRFAAPALAAGNVGLLKHASNVPQCALAIEELVLEAGFPGGAFQTLLIGSNQVAEVLADPRVKAATLTGSTPAGSAVASQAGKLIKKTVLELGGSDAFIVMPSAEFDSTLDTAVSARNINNGQSCIAAKRFIVHAEVYERFEQGFVERMEAVKVGDPLDPETEVGPLATEDILETVDRQVSQSVEKGARLLTGGRLSDRKGYFYQPGVLTDISREAPAYREEVFGPVALLFRVRDLDEAIALANDSPYGLGSSAWTTDPAEQERFINELEAGLTFINAMVASDPRLPFGGLKESGYGRELSAQGIREFMNAKTVWVGGGPVNRQGTE